MSLLASRRGYKRDSAAVTGVVVRSVDNLVVQYRAVFCQGSSPGQSGTTCRIGRAKELAHRACVAEQVPAIPAGVLSPSPRRAI